METETTGGGGRRRKRERERERERERCEIKVMGGKGVCFIWNSTFGPMLIPCGRHNPLNQPQSRLCSYSH